LSKGKREEAEFFSECDVKIVFDSEKGTPFKNDREFRVSAGQATHSGPLKDEVQVGERYHYRVIPLTGAGGADPEIIITN
jgi:hypothetical protein